MEALLDHLDAARYLRIPISWMKQGRERDFPLFLRLADGRYVLFCDTGEALTPVHLARLAKNSVRSLYVREDDSISLDQYLSRDLQSIIEDPAVSTDHKADVVYRCSLRAVTRVFENPGAETIAECRRTVAQLAEATLREPDLGRTLLRITRHDRYTYDHSVNVGIFATTLAQEWYGHDPELMRSLAGAFFLHDVGKCRIPLEVLNKPGKLTPEERAVMEQHPSLGFEILSEAGHVTEEMSIAVLQHHERADGSGYPHGLPDAAIHEFAKVVSIVDVFDALTTHRPYREAMSTFDALSIIRDEMAGDYSPEFFSRFVMLFSNYQYPGA